jgi:hypothetical protein
MKTEKKSYIENLFNNQPMKKNQCNFCKEFFLSDVDRGICVECENISKKRYIETIGTETGEFLIDYDEPEHDLIIFQKGHPFTKIKNLLVDNYKKISNDNFSKQYQTENDYFGGIMKTYQCEKHLFNDPPELKGIFNDDVPCPLCNLEEVLKVNPSEELQEKYLSECQKHRENLTKDEQIQFNRNQIKRLILNK